MLKVERPTVQQNLNFITINIALEGGGEAQSFFHMGSLIIFVRDCQPRSQGLLEEGKRPWHRLASSAISLVYYFTQLIYSKPDIRIFAWRKKLRVKLPTFNDLLSRCVTCRIFLKKIFRICSCRANLFKHHDS